MRLLVMSLLIFFGAFVQAKSCNPEPPCYFSAARGFWSPQFKLKITSVDGEPLETCKFVSFDEQSKRSTYACEGGNVVLNRKVIFNGKDQWTGKTIQYSIYDSISTKHGKCDDNTMTASGLEASARSGYRNYCDSRKTKSGRDVRGPDDK